MIFGTCGVEPYMVHADDYWNVSVFAVCGERVEANTLDAVVDHDACCVCVPFHSSECEFVSVDAANSIE